MEFIVTAIQINEEQSRVQEFLDLVVKKFNFNITVLENSSIKTKAKKSKWEEFANEMDGIFTPNIVQHINKSKNEARENFIANPSA